MLVTITGRLWDHARTRIPQEQWPELWFRPDGPRVGPGLMTGVEVRANLDYPSGSFWVELESDGDAITYTPVVRWLVTDDPQPQRRAFGHAELPKIWPDTGGDIGELTRPQKGWCFVSESVPDRSRRTEWQYNPITTKLYRRSA